MKKSIAVILLALTGTTLAQGPLTPPSGADPSIGPVNALTAGGLPQATMKTLHQVEPRTAIAGGTSGVTISASGAYYLTGNITVATGDGITINASNVTLDLNGFSITTSAAPAAGIGVRLGQGLRNVAIRNGNIGGDGVGGAFTGGVYYLVSGFPQPPSNLRVADLSVAATEFGISTSNSVATCHVERCMVIGGSAHGIQGGIVKDCVVEGGPIFGRIVKDCSVTTPGTSGIVAEVVENCVANSAGNAITAKTLANSVGTGTGVGSYNTDTISAGAALNVWAEGQGGFADGIDATVVTNSVGTRIVDPSGVSNFAYPSGSGIKGITVLASRGTTLYGGIGVSATAVGSSVGSTENGHGIEAIAIVGSNGATQSGNPNYHGIGGEVILASKGIGGVGITVSNQGVASISSGKSIGGWGIQAPESVLLGVNGSTSPLIGGIDAPNGLVIGGYGSSQGIQVSNGLISQSMGVRSLDGGGAQGALKASVVNASKGIGSFNVVGILSDLINSSHGSGIGGTTTGTLEFNSN